MKEEEKSTKPENESIEPVYSDEYCDACECDPCDCNWGNDQ